MEKAVQQSPEATPAHAPHELSPARASKPRAVSYDGYPGNQSALRSLSKTTPRVQYKLRIGAVNDPLEAEADHVADRVMRMPDTGLSTGTAPFQLNRKCDACDEEDAKKKLQPKREGNFMAAGEAPPIVSQTLSSPGQPLDTATRAFMEPRFGRDFSDVRIHCDNAAGTSARAVDALAYTVASNVVFAPGRYAPHSREGRRLLAHELAHVVQQSGGGGPDGGKALQRYGQANSCTATQHMTPYIWPGIDLAKLWVAAAIAATDGSHPLTSDVSRYLTTFFGNGSSNPANLATINANFRTIATAIVGQYNFHCSKRNDTSDKDALVCNGENAQTSQAGNHDITLCFDDLGKWSVPWAAWLIVHENVHRGLNVWGHGWEAGDIARCISAVGAPNGGQLDLTNPDSYACFALSVYKPPAGP